MALKLKTKIFLALSFLFLVLLIVGLAAVFYIQNLIKQSKEILKDNYASVEYAKILLENMSKMQLAEAILFNKAADSSQINNSLQKYQLVKLIFEQNLRKAEGNITEIGEKELLERLRGHFENYSRHFNQIYTKDFQKDSLNNKKYINLLLYDEGKVILEINELYQVNKKALFLKNRKVADTGSEITVYLRLIGSVGLITTLLFIFILPAYLADPIKDLTAKIKEISLGNYDQKLDLRYKTKDEVGELAESFNKMAFMLKQYDESNLAKIMFEKKRTETLIKTFSEAILVLDENMFILNVNVLMQNLLDLSEKDLLGEYAPNIADKNDLLKNLLKDLTIPDLEGEKKEKNETIKIFSEGKESFFLKEILKITGEHKGTGKLYAIGYAIILKNITLFKELDSAKTNFIATMSHELKTPLASTKMSLELLNNEKVGSLNPEQKDLLAHINEDTGRMLKMVGELLNMTQLESGNIQLNPTPADAWEIIDYTIETLKIQASQKNIDIVKEGNQNIPKVFADIEKTSWILINLLNNAIRYTPENQKVIVRLIEKDAHIQFSVQDFGQGISSRYQNKIFDKFFQIPKDENTKAGTGLGLAISKDFILAQKGNIWLESVQGQGCTFYFTLPVYQEN